MTSRSKQPWTSAWSVSRILDLGYPMKWVDESALERGLEVHAWTEAHDRGEPYRIAEAFSGFADAYKQACYSLSPSWDEGGIEHRFDTDTYHGYIDRVGSIKGRRCVLDIKTGAGSSSSPRTPIQLAAYAAAVSSHPEDLLRVELRLSPEGGYRVVTHTNANDFIVWRSLLESALSKEARHG
jgi:hypothetical protein